MPFDRPENRAAGTQLAGIPAIQPREKSPVEINWSTVESQAKRISDLVNALYTKLHPVLTPNAPPDGGSSKGQLPAMSPMAESFVGVADNLGSSASALERLLERIEL
jgi:hypothetical protein